MNQPTRRAAAVALGALVLVGLTGAVVGTAAARPDDAHRAAEHSGRSATSHHGSGTVTLSDSERADLRQAKRATAKYQRVSAAEHDGWALPDSGPLQQCISSYDNTGAMGYHYINGTNVSDNEVTATKPEALVYYRNGDHQLRLGALEYVVFADGWDATHSEPPSLFGQDFMRVDAPNRYELPAFYALHVWLWKTNPAGLFAGFNPNLSCECGHRH